MNDFTSEILISSIEDNLREFWGNWGQAPQSELYDGPNMMRLYTGVPYAFCNGVVCSQFMPEDIDKAIDETVAYFLERNATWEWIVGPNSRPVYLDKRLEKHGLFFHGEAIGMAIKLDTLSQQNPGPDNMSIIQAGNDETLKIWANTMIEGFESPLLYPNFVHLECSLGCNQPSYRRYMALLDHQPVSTCALFLGQKVAGIYCVSTLPKARRLGVGAAITHYALHEAQRMGYHIAVLQSSSMGRTVYRRIGFQEFSTLRLFRPPSQFRTI